MKRELPLDLPHPELEYLDAAWRSRCACEENCAGSPLLPSACDALKKEIDRIATDARIAYRARPAQLNSEFHRLCGLNWGSSLVEQRCAILANLGARGTEVAFFEFLGIALLLTVLAIAGLKKQGHIRASLVLMVVRLAPVVISSVALSLLGSFVSIQLGGASAFVAIFVSIPFAALAFAFVLYRHFRSRLLLGGFALAFAVLSNFWIASKFTKQINRTLSVDATAWTLQASEAMSQRIQALLAR